MPRLAPMSLLCGDEDIVEFDVLKEAATTTDLMAAGSVWDLFFDGVCNGAHPLPD